MSDLVKTAIRLDSDDLDWFRKQYRSVGYNRALRTLMRRHRRSVEARASQKKKKRGTDVRLTDSDLSGFGN